MANEPSSKFAILFTSFIEAEIRSLTKIKLLSSQLIRFDKFNQYLYLQRTALTKNLLMRKAPPSRHNFHLQKHQYAPGSYLTVGFYIVLLKHDPTQPFKVD